MSRVFILEQPRRAMDTSKADRWGEVTFVFDDSARRASVFQSQLYVHQTIEALVAHNYDPEVDVFCVVGSMVNVALALMAVFTLAQSNVKMLLFNSQLGDYELKEVSLGDAEQHALGLIV